MAPNASVMQHQTESAIDLEIAEVPYESGAIRFRYARRLATDGSHWIRHGKLTSFNLNGQLASHGQYEHRVEIGVWQEFHE